MDKPSTAVALLILLAGVMLSSLAIVGVTESIRHGAEKRELADKHCKRIINC